MQVDAPRNDQAATQMMLSSPSSTSSSAAALAAKGDRLRSLLFGAEHAERNGDLAGAQSLWLQLLTFLQAEGGLSVTTQAHGRALRDRCGRRLHALAVERAAVAAAAAREQEQQLQHQQAAAAAGEQQLIFFGGCDGENRSPTSSCSSSSTAVADLAARLRLSESASATVRGIGLLFAAARPPPRKAPRRGDGGGGNGSGGEHTLAVEKRALLFRAQQQRAAAAAAAAAADHFPSQPPRPPPRQPLGSSSAAFVNKEVPPPPAPSSFARGGALKRDSHGVVKGFYSAEGRGEEAGAAPPPPPPSVPPQQQQQQQQQRQQQQQQRWANNNSDNNGEANAAPARAPAAPRAAGGGAGAGFGFQTARSKLISEVTKAGADTPGFAARVGKNNGDDGLGSLDPREYSSGSMFPNGRGAFAASGLHPPGLLKNRSSNSASNNAAAAASASGFVPPFIARAMGAPTGAGLRRSAAQQQQQQRAPPPNNAEASGPLSERTRRLLGIDGFLPDGTTPLPLPDSLSRLDPHTVELVCNELLDDAPSVSWDDIAGQASAKRAVHELAVWPMLNPHLFTGARAPPAGLLLFGPPGTGKTLLGRAVAANVDASFFSISASSLTSKWIGEGEKLVRALFAVARALAPSVVFVDEIDSLLSARKAEGEHEASRRMKTELLVQMEGCANGSGSSRDENGDLLPPRRVLVIGATNRPEELDEAARRRMPKQLYVPLPCDEARRAMVMRAFGGAVDGGEGEGAHGAGGSGENGNERPTTRAGAGGVVHALTSADIARVVARTEGYSGSDMRALIQEACQGPVRDALRGSLPGMRGGGGEGATNAPSAVATAKQLGALTAADLRPVVLRDFAAASRVARPSVEPDEVKRYEEYDAKHGARYCADGGVVAAGAGAGSGDGGGRGGASAGEEGMELDGW